MLLALMIYISILLSSLFLISRYITYKRSPLNHDSPVSDKLLVGFFYGVIGVILMYVHKEIEGSLADPRQIVITLAFFYGGWIPAIVVVLPLFLFRVILFGAWLKPFLISTALTLGIAQFFVKLNIPRSNQWYLITVGVAIEIYIVVLIRDGISDFFHPELVHFIITFILGSIFSYHFLESLRQSYIVMEELRVSKESLQRSEEQYRLIAENSSDLISVLDTQGKAIYLSPSHLSVIGIILEDQLGRPMTQLIHHEDYPHVKHTWYEAIQNKQASQSEYRIQHANGHWIWVESHYMPVTCQKDDVEKVLVISRDVTDRKNTEELIRDTEKLSVVGELAAGIAHEIRNPLTTIKGFTQMMLKEPSSPFFLNLIHEELNRIELITTELLYLAKPQIQDVKETDINELIIQVTTLMNPEAMLNNTILTVQCGKGLPAITCVANHLKQVFINLLKNALEAMPAGGEIHIETKQEKEGTMLISIKDQGTGIPEERLDRLGQPFYSLKEKGTGIGLTICKKIIQEHLGSLTFHSEVKRGTTVEVRLPMKKKDSLVSCSKDSS